MPIPRKGYSTVWLRRGGAGRLAACRALLHREIPEIEPISVAGVQWKPLRRTLGIDAFGINAYSAAALGDHVIEEHTEETLGHQEAYVVIVGHATFFLDGEEIDAPQGTVVFIRDPKVRRYATAVEPGTTVLAIGGVPGVHTPSAWEWYFEAETLPRERRSRRGTRAARRRPGAVSGPRRGCSTPSRAGSRSAGDTDAAIASLNAAIEVKPEVAEWAKDDADLDAIRGLPGSPL